jgi:type III secretory pathway component EscT
MRVWGSTSVYPGAVPSIVDAVARELAGSGLDLGALGLAWARAAPVVALVPAFGLRALPAPARAVMGLAFAASIFPAIAPSASAGAGPWAPLVALEIVRGIPVALSAAVPLWAATMAGGVADALRGPHDTVAAPTVEGRATPLGVPMSLLASAFFLSTGGPARVAKALAAAPVGAHPVLAAADNLVSGITLAVALGGPLLAAAVVVEVAAALVARAASPAQVHALLAPLRSLATLAATALVLHRIAALLARAVQVP